jgi:hypothetical protein
MQLRAGGLERLHRAAGKAAHRELRGALHEKDDRVAFDLGLDAVFHGHGFAPATVGPRG